MGHVGALQFRAQLQQEQFDAALLTYRQLPTAAEREFFAYAATEEEVLAGDAIPGWAHAFVERHPQESLPWTIRGGLGIAAGWKARTGYRAAEVQESAWPIFFQFLNDADDDLVRATTIDPDDAAPWSKMLTSGRGLQIPKDELGDRFVEAARRGQGLLFAHEQLLQGICAKWSGSHAEMFDFAREAAASNPPGSPLHALVVDAHLEQWIDLDCQPSQYFVGAVAQEIMQAARHSVLDPSFVDDDAHPYGAAARNVFAVGLTLAGARREGWEQARLLGSRVAKWPWYYLGDPAERFEWVLRKGPG
jgi:hypothetical protein